MSSFIRLSTLCLLVVSTAMPLSGQTARTAQSTADAYGARLANPAEPVEAVNVRRYNNRVDNRVNSRISLRIERFRVDAVSDPTALIRQRGGGSVTSSYRAASINSQNNGSVVSDHGLSNASAYAFDDQDQTSSNSSAPRR